MSAKLFGQQGSQKFRQNAGVRDPICLLPENKRFFVRGKLTQSRGGKHASEFGILQLGRVLAGPFGAQNTHTAINSTHIIPAGRIRGILQGGRQLCAVQGIPLDLRQPRWFRRKRGAVEIWVPVRFRMVRAES